MPDFLLEFTSQQFLVFFRSWTPKEGGSVRQALVEASIHQERRKALELEAEFARFPRHLLALSNPWSLGVRIRSFNAVTKIDWVFPPLWILEYGAEFISREHCVLDHFLASGLWEKKS